jgi:ssDNA-binding Zn-finger/Zn-ribbon topoisomerase 1
MIYWKEYYQLDYRCPSCLWVKFIIKKTGREDNLKTGIFLDCVESQRGKDYNVMNLYYGECPNCGDKYNFTQKLLMDIEGNEGVLLIWSEVEV